MERIEERAQNGDDELTEIRKSYPHAERAFGRRADVVVLNGDQSDARPENRWVLGTGSAPPAPKQD